METSILIARLLGPVLLVAVIPTLATPKVITEITDDFLKSPSLIFISGVMVLVGGLAIVNAHNRWAVDWTLLVTLFGWALVIGGALRVAAPKWVARIGTSMTARPLALRVAGVVWAIIGAVLSVKGYR